MDQMHRKYMVNQVHRQWIGLVGFGKQQTTANTDVLILQKIEQKKRTYLKKLDLDYLKSLVIWFMVTLSETVVNSLKTA